MSHDNLNKLLLLRSMRLRKARGQVGQARRLKREADAAVLDAQRRTQTIQDAVDARNANIIDEVKSYRDVNAIFATITGIRNQGRAQIREAHDHADAKEGVRTDAERKVDEARTTERTLSKSHDQLEQLTDKVRLFAVAKAERGQEEETADLITSRFAGGRRHVG